MLSKDTSQDSEKKAAPSEAVEKLQLAGGTAEKAGDRRYTRKAPLDWRLVTVESLREMDKIGRVKRTDDILVRFWRDVDKGNGEDACWLWTGRTFSNGYGIFRIGAAPQKNLIAHRISLVIAGVDISKSPLVMHKCDVRLCVNPSHLIPGSYKDNTADCQTKGRFRPGHVPGEKHGNSVVTESVVRAIRADAPTMSKPQLSKKYGIGVSGIAHIIKGRSWKHIL